MKPIKWTKSIRRLWFAVRSRGKAQMALAGNAKNEEAVGSLLEQRQRAGGSELLLRAVYGPGQIAQLHTYPAPPPATNLSIESI